MHYQNVCLESLAYTLPEEIVTSDQIETWLEPLYQRLRLPAGRLELMTGIRERRFWPRGMLPSEMSVPTGEKAIRTAGIDRSEIGALIHASVCRDYLEPATACGVHRRLGLPRQCLIYDVSNACLGILNGMLQVANLIELGQIRAGLVVGTEGSRQLVETTIRHLNENRSLTRDDVKLAVASLTIGSGSAAVLLCDRELSRTQHRLTSAVARANTEFCELCHSGRDEAADGMQPLMTTDSERLLREGVALAEEAFQEFLSAADWSADEIDKTFCHQVGNAHRKLLFQALQLDTRIDFGTFEFLGNTGTVALPISAAIGIERGLVQPGDRVAMLGIGSGINTLMLGVEWAGVHTKSRRFRSPIGSRQANGSP
jgi:3-oxoacyl-[acyl-carrier-protein] synthase-3